MIRMIEDKLLNRAQVAEMLGVAEHTLACWRSAGKGPQCVKFGTGRSAAVRYYLSAVEAWVNDPARAEAEAQEPWREARRQAIASRLTAAKAKAAPAPRPRRRPRPRT
jgi:predicted DNA-binding transcriptional regulator AlpA